MRNLRTTLLILFIILWPASASGAVAVTDDAGQRHLFEKPPVRVVSLVPSATEIICALGAAEALAGVTYHDEHLPALAGAPLVGGAFSAQFDLIQALEPDLLIVAPRDYRRALSGRGAGRCPILVWDDGVGLKEAETRLRWLGEIFGQSVQAEKVIAANNEYLKTIALKLAKIPPERRRRTMRLMYSDGKLLSPGDASFLNEIIAAAGGLPPRPGPGAFVEVSRESWEKFAPEVVFDCGADQARLRELLAAEGWSGAPAVKEGRIYNFPCALTCRAAGQVGYFTAWLAATIYGDEFARPENLVFPQEVLAQRRIELDLPYVAEASIVDSRLMDFVHRTLVINFKNPQRIFSTGGGQRDGIVSVGNSYAPPPTWGLYHQIGYEESGDLLHRILGLDREKTELMLTGADLNNLAIKSASFRDLKVTALVTAGVEGNALRTSRDVGAWYEPGTINILILTNHRLSPGAGARALVTVTEAKTAALWDMDIRSVQSAALNPATGTGTDSVIVVAGEGLELQASGGHSKLGELLAEAVHAAVREAILKQNGKPHKRHVFARLAERGFSPSSLTGGPDCPCLEKAGDFQAGLERLLLTPRYQGFLEAAFSLSDAAVMGQLDDTSSFEGWALLVASEIAGQPVAALEDISAAALPPLLKTAVDALGTGLKQAGAATDGAGYAPCTRSGCLERADGRQP